MAMNYLVFRGIGTSTPQGVIPNAFCSTQLTDVYVSKMPSHRKAAMRYSEYYVAGRDGALHVDEGFSNFDIKVVLVLLNASVQRRYEVNAWADGTGKLISSDDVYTVGQSIVAKAYKATVKEQIVWNRVQAPSGFYDTATITFNCQPCLYEAIDSVTTLTESGAIINPGSATSYPMIQVNGAGDASFSINGGEIQIDAMTSGVPVYIDCENGYVYTESGATSIRGDIPHFELGTNNIVIGENVTSLVITPHWRWV